MALSVAYSAGIVTVPLPSTEIVVAWAPVAIRQATTASGAQKVHFFMGCLSLALSTSIGMSLYDTFSGVSVHGS